MIALISISACPDCKTPLDPSAHDGMGYCRRCEELVELINAVDHPAAS